MPHGMSHVEKHAGGYCTCIINDNFIDWALMVATAFQHSLSYWAPQMSGDIVLT
jgi:hypothetical protein